jgi:hypothetical protein
MRTTGSFKHYPNRVGVGFFATFNHHITVSYAACGAELAEVNGVYSGYSSLSRLLAKCVGRTYLVIWAAHFLTFQRVVTTRPMSV